MFSSSFTGGLKLPSYGSRLIPDIVQVPLPDQATVLLQQHRGEPCVLQVKKGGQVKRGSILGLSSHTAVHSPVSGQVTRIETSFVLPNAQNTIAITIESDSSGATDYAYLQDEHNLGKLIKAGINDEGTVTMPVLEKVQLARASQVKTLIINTLDELLISSSKSYLLANFGTEVQKGIDILLRMTGAKQAVLVAYTPDLARLDQSLLNQDSIQVLAVPPKHPQHMDQLLVQAVSRQEYPAQKKPEDLAFSIFSIETAYWLSQCLSQSLPQLEKYLTLSGSGLDQHRNLLVSIGTPLKQVLQNTGLDQQQVGKVIVGGALTGRAISSLDMPVTKDMPQVIVLDKDKLYTPIAEACIKCGYCVQACPMRLMPFLISGFSEGGHYSLAAKNDIFSCIECGCCAYVCPVLIPMVQWIQLGKSMLTAQRSQEHV